MYNWTFSIYTIGKLKPRWSFAAIPNNLYFYRHNISLFFGKTHRGFSAAFSQLQNMFGD